MGAEPELRGAQRRRYRNCHEDAEESLRAVLIPRPAVQGTCFRATAGIQVFVPRSSLRGVEGLAAPCGDNCFVTAAAVRAVLPLRPSAGPKEKSAPAIALPST